MTSAYSIKKPILIVPWPVQNIFKAPGLVDVNIQLAVGSTDHSERYDIQGFQYPKDRACFLQEGAAIINQIELSFPRLLYDLVHQYPEAIHMIIRDRTRKWRSSQRQ